MQPLSHMCRLAVIPELCGSYRWTLSSLIPNCFCICLFTFGLLLHFVNSLLNYLLYCALVQFHLVLFISEVIKRVAGQKLPRSSNMVVHFKLCPSSTNVRRSPTLHAYIHLSKHTPNNGFHMTSQHCSTKV